MGVTEKFKVGDVIRRKSPAMYVITSYHVKCRIVAISASDNHDISVEVLDGDNKGESVWVESSYFEIVSEDVEWV